jgi:hypothetical protein
VAYTFTITEITPQIGLTVNPAAVFTTTQQQVVLNVTETQPQFAITTPANNQFTVNDNGFLFTLTNIDTVVTMTQQPSALVTLTNAVSTFNIATSATNINVVDGPNIVYTATTQISQIQTENMATIFKGEFTSTDVSIYYRGHIVRYNQNIYVATVEPGARITNPAAPPGNSQWTLIFSQTGLTGWQVEAMEKAYNLGPWNAGATYTLNSFVHYQGYIWTLINEAGSYNSEPSRSNTNWLQIGGQGDQPLFTTSSVTFNSLTLNGNLVAAGGVFSNLTVTNRLTAGGIRYPITNGNYGQVLTTNGENEANWADIGAIVTASIRPATRENLGGVIVGPGLNVTVGGVLSVNTGTGGALIGWNLTDNLRTNGFSIETGVPPVISQAFPVPKLEIGSGLRDNMDAALIFDARSTNTSIVRLLADTVRIASGNASVNNTIPYANEIRISNTRTELMGTVALTGNVTIGSTNTTQITIGNINVDPFYAININSPLRGGRSSAIGRYFDITDSVRLSGRLVGGGDTQPIFTPAGIRFSDGTTLTTAATTSTQIATTSTLGVVRVGPTLVINPTTGVLNAIQYILPTASASVLGGIKIGAGLAINTSTGVVSVTTTSEFIIPPADETTIGGVRIATDPASVRARGAGVYMDGQFIKGRIADTNGLGVVMLGNYQGITANGSGELQLQYATVNTIGGVKIDGTTIVMDGNGVISATAGTTTGTGKTYFAGNGIAINTLSNIISLTTATTSTIGGIVIGDGLEVVNGKTTLKLGGNNLFIDGNGALNVTTTASSGVFDLSADSYTNGYSIRHSVASSSSFLTIGGSQIDLSTPTGSNLSLRGNSVILRSGQTGGLGSLTLGSYSEFRTNTDQGLFLLSSAGATLQANASTKLVLDTDNVSLQSNSDSYQLYLGRFGSQITRLGNANSAKLVLDTNETILTNPTVVKIQSPDTQFGSLFNSRIYAGVIYNFSGTGPPLLAEGVQYADLTVQRTAYPAYDYGQVIRGSAFGPTVPQDFNNRSLAVDFNS